MESNPAPLRTRPTAPLQGELVDQDAGTLFKLHPDNEAKPLEFFTNPDSVQTVIAALSKAVLAIPQDLSTDKGRKAIASTAYRVAQTKTYLDELGKEEVARLKALPAKVDAGRRELREGLDALRDAVRKPLTEWEALRALEADFVKRMEEWPTKALALDTNGVAQAIEAIAKDWPETSWMNFEVAMNTRQASLKQLEALLIQRRQEDADKAELARLRKEEEDRKQKERDEALRREGEERARQQAAAAPPSLPLDVAPDPPARTMQLGATPQAQAGPAVATQFPTDAALKQARNAALMEALEDLKREGVPEEHAKKALGAIARGRVRNLLVSYKVP